MLLFVGSYWYVPTFGNMCHHCTPQHTACQALIVNIFQNDADNPLGTILNLNDARRLFCSRSGTQRTESADAATSHNIAQSAKKGS